MMRPCHRLSGALLLAALLFGAACAPETTGAERAAPDAAASPGADPDRQLALARRQLGLGLEQAGDIAGAVDEFSAALALGGWTADELAGRDDTPYADLARICDRTEPEAQVVRACAAVIGSFRFSPARLAGFLVNRGDAHRRLGEPERALNDYAAALTIETSNPRALAGRGLVRIEKGAYRAAADLKRAIGSGATEPEVRLARAGALTALDDFEGAVAEYDHVLSDPEDVAAHPEAYRGRATVHCRTGAADAAAIDWQVWLAAVPGGSEQVQEMLWALGYLRGPMAADFGPAAVAGLRAWTRAGCPAA